MECHEENKEDFFFPEWSSQKILKKLDTQINSLLNKQVKKKYYGFQGWFLNANVVKPIQIRILEVDMDEANSWNIIVAIILRKMKT